MCIEERAQDRALGWAMFKLLAEDEGPAGADRNIPQIRYLKARGPFPKEKEEWYLFGVSCISPINSFRKSS